LLNRLEKAREQSGRTLTAEITERLKGSFDPSMSRDDFHKYLSEMRAEMRKEMMREMRQEFDRLRVDLQQRKDEPQ